VSFLLPRYGIFFLVMFCRTFQRWLKNEIRHFYFDFCFAVQCFLFCSAFLFQLLFCRTSFLFVFTTEWHFSFVYCFAVLCSYLFSLPYGILLSIIVLPYFVPICFSIVRHFSFDNCFAVLCSNLFSLPYGIFLLIIVLPYFVPICFLYRRHFTENFFQYGILFYVLFCRIAYHYFPLKTDFYFNDLTFIFYFFIQDVGRKRVNDAGT